MIDAEFIDAEPIDAEPIDDTTIDDTTIDDEFIAGEAHSPDRCNAPGSVDLTRYSDDQIERCGDLATNRDIGQAGPG